MTKESDQEFFNRQIRQTANDAKRQQRPVSEAEVKALKSLKDVLTHDNNNGNINDAND